MEQLNPGQTISIRSRCAVAARTVRKVFSSRKPKLSLLTDFGTGDEAVFAIKSAAKSVNALIEIDDICHNVPLGNLLIGAWRLKRAVGLPTEHEGDAYVAVVDPGVGTCRKNIIIRTAAGKYLIGPDNGVLSLAFMNEGVEAAVCIENEGLTLLNLAKSRTFHGKDVFAPASAHLLRGVPLDEFGGRIDAGDLARITISNESSERYRAGCMVDIDGFGSLRTNVPNHLPPASIGKPARFSIDGLGRPINGIATIVRTFGEAGAGEMVIVQSSTGCLDLAKSMGHAGDALGISPEHIIVGADLEPRITVEFDWRDQVIQDRGRAAS